jgi:hypothetical protein
MYIIHSLKVPFIYLPSATEFYLESITIHYVLIKDERLNCKF